MCHFFIYRLGNVVLSVIYHVSPFERQLSSERLVKRGHGHEHSKEHRATETFKLTGAGTLFWGNTVIHCAHVTYDILNDLFFFNSQTFTFTSR